TLPCCRPAAFTPTAQNGWRRYRSIAELAGFRRARRRLSRQSLGAQPFAIFVECLLGGVVLAHRLLSLRAPFGVSRLALLVGGGLARGKIFGHPKHNVPAGERFPSGHSAART